MRCKRYTPPDLNLLLQQGHAKKARLLAAWRHDPSVSQAEIDYWLLFIVDKYFATETRRAWYVADFGVVDKITQSKKRGEFPPVPRHNAHFLPMFKLAYGFPR